MYKKEKITEEDWKKIMLDFEHHHDANKLRQIKNVFPEYGYIIKWVINHENNSYLLKGPQNSDYPYADSVFTFFYKKSLYWIYLLYPTKNPDFITRFDGGVVKLHERSEEDIEKLDSGRLKELKQAVKDAFCIYGYLGDHNSGVYQVIFEEEL